jgi:hypothetical protein
MLLAFVMVPTCVNVNVYIYIYLQIYINIYIYTGGHLEECKEILQRDVEL